MSNSERKNDAHATLRDVQTAYGKRYPGEMLERNGPLDNAFLGEMGEKFFALLLTMRIILVSSNCLQSFSLLIFFCKSVDIPSRRARHCYSEAQRVLDFFLLCANYTNQIGATSSRNEEILRKLGDLMNASHDSCRDLYNCSCPELDRLVKICR